VRARLSRWRSPSRSVRAQRERRTATDFRATCSLPRAPPLTHSLAAARERHSRRAQGTSSAVGWYVLVVANARLESRCMSADTPSWTPLGCLLHASRPALSLTPRFLIDGFPRKMDQALKFDQSVCPSRAVLFFSATEDVMLERLEERGKTSGRDDDNKESIVKRFR